MESKCHCQHCNQSIAFPSDMSGMTLACPTCSMETILFMPQMPRAKKESNREHQLMKWSMIPVAITAIISAIVFHSDSQSNAGDAWPLAIAGGFVMALMIAAGAMIYFLPAIVAWRNKKQNTTAIFVLNFIGGWTFIGYVVALVWAYTKDATHPASNSR